MGPNRRLYNEQMASHAQGGILRSGETGGYSYAVREGFVNKPVNLVSFWDSIRYANWLQNGMSNGEQNGSTTEDGSYTITQDGIDENSIVRNPEADVFLANWDEWYKAAYYDVDAQEYYTYPIGPGTAECVEPSADTGKSANCNYVIGEYGGLTEVGAYTLSPSPSGTYDQGGNVYEWVDSRGPVGQRKTRGGSYDDPLHHLLANQNFGTLAWSEQPWMGFRLVATVPESSPFLQVGAALLVLALLSYRRACSREGGVRDG